MGNASRNSPTRWDSHPGRMMVPVSKRGRSTKAAKQCYFCGRTGSMSKEHAWPQWLGRGAEVEPTQTTRTLGFRRTAVDTYSETVTEVTTKPGSVLTTRIREVCVACNSGWMSRLEQDVRAPLERLWAPDHPFGFTSLTPSEVHAVAAWAVKTAWVRERVQQGSVTPTASMRQDFADTGTPPEFTSVWVGRHRGLSNFGVYVAQIDALHQDEPWHAKASRHVLICTLTFRGLSILVRTDDGWGVPQFAPPEDRWARLWPRDLGLPWPPARVVTDDDVLAVAAGFSGWMRVPDLPNFERAEVRHNRRN
jgi:hypothetical protein